MGKNGEQTEKIKKWLNQQGYPLEMEVAQSFRKLTNLDVIQSLYYQDFDTKKLREIDVTVQGYSEPKTDPPTSIVVCCLIECKSTKDKPWLLFVSDTNQDNFSPPLHFHFISSVASNLTLFEMMKNEEEREILTNLPLYKNQRISYGVTAAFTGGEDVPYKAMMSASKAAIARTRIFEGEMIPNVGVICIPVVVIDGNLFECKLDSKSEVQLSEVDSGLCDWGGAGERKYIHIVTESTLNDFVKKTSKTIQQLLELFERNNDLLLSNIKAQELKRSGGPAFL